MLALSNALIDVAFARFVLCLLVAAIVVVPLKARDLECRRRVLASPNLRLLVLGRGRVKAHTLPDRTEFGLFIIC